MASLDAVALGFGALMGNGPVEGWAAGTDEVHAATTTETGAAKAPAAVTETSEQGAQSPAAISSEPATDTGTAEESAPAKSPKKADSFEFSTPVEAEDSMVAEANEEADSEASGPMEQDEATGEKAVAASGTFTSSELLPWQMKQTTRSAFKCSDPAARASAWPGRTRSWGNTARGNSWTGGYVRIT